jgi:sulfate permease, SulP family
LIFIPVEHSFSRGNPVPLKEPTTFYQYTVQARRLLTKALEYSQLSFFPNRSFFRSYSQATFRKDLHAAANVAVLAFPQGIAFALMSGLPIEYGIYGSAVAAIVAPFFASSRFTVVGPTNATSVLILSTFLALGSAADKVQTMSMLLLLVGLFLIAGAFLRVATLFQYVSQTVVIAYITAAATLIVVNQVHNVLGYSLGGAGAFMDVCLKTIRYLPQTHGPSLVVGLMTAGIWWASARHFKRWPTVAVTLVLASLGAWVLAKAGLRVENLEGIPIGHWPLSIPSLDFELMSQLASSAMAIAFLCVLEATSIGKSLANRAGDRLDSNQEMLGVGMANLACSFFSGMPASGSLTRSHLNWKNGAVTPMSSIICGLICALSVLTLGRLFVYIPKPALAVIVIFVGLSLINTDQIKVAFRSTRSDRAVFLITLISGLLFALDFAIYLGVATSIVLFLRKAAEPELVEYSFNEQGNLQQMEKEQTRSNPQISIVHVEGDLFFGASELFRDQVRRVCEDANLKVIILRLKNAYHLDATSVLALEELIRYMRESDRHLIISGARKDVYRVVKNSGLIDYLGRDNFFMGSPQNPNVATRNALKRAQQLIGDSKAEIKIYYDPAKAAVLKT